MVRRRRREFLQVRLENLIRIGRVKFQTNNSIVAGPNVKTILALGGWFRLTIEPIIKLHRSCWVSQVNAEPLIDDLVICPQSVWILPYPHIDVRADIPPTRRSSGKGIPDPISLSCR